MSIKSMFLSLFRLADGEPREDCPPPNKEAQLAQMDSEIDRTFKAILDKASSCPEALDAAIAGLDSISMNMRHETEKLKEGGVK